MSNTSVSIQSVENLLPKELLDFSVHEYVFEYCPKCGVHHPVLIKAGKANSGKQIYQLTYYSHQSEQKWNQLIDDTVQGIP